MPRDPTPSKTASASSLTEASTSADVAAFVAKARAMSTTGAGGRGRLVFALDATLSRQPTWDMACALQADMFREAAALGQLDIRLVYFRGAGECRASGWCSDSAHLARLMNKIDCRGGQTQIGKVLSEVRREAVDAGVKAVVFVGDAMEESADALCAKAGELGLLKVPVFLFQEGHDATAERTFREIARLTGARAAARRRGLRGRRSRRLAPDRRVRWRRGGVARPTQVRRDFRQTGRCTIYRRCPP